MLKDFDAIKNQLTEFADVINKFKSEAVQLRIVELVFQGKRPQDSSHSTTIDDHIAKSSKNKRKRKKIASKEVNNDEPKKKRATSGSGAISTLIKVYEEGYLKQPRTIKDILTHCETNLARRIKANEISTKLARMVRSGELTRVKNSDNQYEYTQP